MLGVERGRVEVVAYDPAWPRLFSEEERQLRCALGALVVDIQHVGSTSVPGLAAKPILDIAIALRRISDAEQCVAPLEALGYEYKGECGLPNRHYFTKGSPRTHHLHVVEATSAYWANHLCFRDRLRSDEELARRYAQLKSELAQKYVTDREAYTEAKAPFIQTVLQSS
ncbi:MAG TPA: GrpB family protein [Pyrinomonadaceae bacterium]|nr:GrpB family protein [Pyrinomonadaceae bacterium]